MGLTRRYRQRSRGESVPGFARATCVTRRVRREAVSKSPGETSCILPRDTCEPFRVSACTCPLSRRLSAQGVVRRHAPGGGSPSADRRVSHGPEGLYQRPKRTVSLELESRELRYASAILQADQALVLQKITDPLTRDAAQQLAHLCVREERP